MRRRASSSVARMVAAANSYNPTFPLGFGRGLPLAAHAGGLSRLPAMNDFAADLMSPPRVAPPVSDRSSRATRCPFPPLSAAIETCWQRRRPFWGSSCTFHPETIITTAMLHEELPLAVTKELDVQGLNGVPVLLSTSTDLSLSGQPRRHWIVATRDNVAAVAERRADAATRASTATSPVRRRRRSSAPRAPSAPASCRPTSTTTGSIWPATRTPRPTGSTASPATSKTSAPPASSRSTPSATAARTPTAPSAASGCRRRRSRARAAFRARRSSAGWARCCGRTARRPRSCAA